MVETKNVKLVDHTTHPYDNGAIGAIASVGVAGSAIGAAVVVATELSGIALGSAVGGAVGVVAALAGIEAIKHRNDVPRKNKIS